MSAVRRYALASAAARIEPMGEHLAVFNGASFETHLLNPAAGVLLQAIAEAPRSMDELAGALAHRLAPEEVSNVAAHVETAIGQFLRLGLITFADVP
jgi:PqqD family protein of HPr-rel-A system